VIIKVFEAFQGELGLASAHAPYEVTRSVRLGRIIRFLSPMDRRWGSKSSKALGLDAVLSFP
jgi:hypothetical protein